MKSDMASFPGPLPFDLSSPEIVALAGTENWQLVADTLRTGMPDVLARAQERSYTSPPSGFLTGQQLANDLRAFAVRVAVAADTSVWVVSCPAKSILHVPARQ